MSARAYGVLTRAKTVTGVAAVERCRDAELERGMVLSTLNVKRDNALLILSIMRVAIWPVPIVWLHMM